MCSWDKLPSEVIIQILIYLKDDLSTIQQCQYLCRTWRDPAQKQLYKTVKLVNADQAELFIQCMSGPATHTSKFVRLLSLERSLIESPSIEFIFPRLFDLCPNITRLEAPPGQSSSFWAKLLLEHSKGNVSHLREIPLTDLSCDDNIKLYGYVAYLLRSHLTSLTMCDWPSRNPSFRNDMVAQHLRDFRHLKQISAHLRGSKSIYEVFSFIQNCSTLKSVDISMTDINRNIHDYVEENDEDPNWNDIKPTRSLSRIERLNAEYIPMTNKIMQYILHLFPHLNELYFKSDNPNWEEDMELLFRVQTEGLRISTESWLEFLLHLYRRVPKFEVSNLFMTNIPDVLVNLLKHTNYGETMKIVYLERDTFFDFQPFLGIDSESASKKFTRGCDFYNHRTIEVVYAAEEDHYEVLPHLPVLERVGHSLKGLEIQIHEADRFADSQTDLYNMACGYFIDHTFRCCPLLDTLSLKKCYLLNCNPNMHLGQAVQVVRIIDCKVNTPFLQDLSIRLPNLSFLTLHRCLIMDPDNDEYITDAAFPIEMMYTSFDTLRITGLNIPGIRAVQFRILTRAAEFYFVVNEANQVSVSSDEVMQDAVMNSDEVKILLTCRDIKTLVFELNSVFDVVFHFTGDKYEISTKQSAAYISNIKEIH